jgi:hypothetical protein
MLFSWHPNESINIRESSYLNLPEYQNGSGGGQSSRWGRQLAGRKALIAKGWQGFEKPGEISNFVRMDREKVKKYAKRLGLAGFLFFLIKGLIWLAIIFGGTKLLFGE